MTGCSPGGQPAPGDVLSAVDGRRRCSSVVQRGVALDRLVSVCRRLRRQFDARSTVLDAVLAVLYDVPDAEFERILRPPWYEAS